MSCVPRWHFSTRRVQPWNALAESCKDPTSFEDQHPGNSNHVTKEPGLDSEGREVLKCGFKIGGGIDQDYRKSPQGYTDNGIYVTEVHDGSPAAKSGLRMHDKILQCNGYDFTMVTHKKAVDYIKKHPVLNLLVARKGVTST